MDDIKCKVKRKGKRRGYIAGLLIFTAGFGVCLGLFAMERYAVWQAEKRLEQLADQTAPEPETAEPVFQTEEETDEAEAEETAECCGIAIPEKEINFEALWQENEDIYAWLYLPGTAIDYPVLQHPEDDSYYLEHNIDGSTGYPGCIYTEGVNSRDFSDPHTVLYGHNMKDGSMFGALHRFEDRQYFDENQHIYVYTPDEVMVYHIFAAYKYNAIHLVYNFDLENPDIFQNYLDQIFSIRDMGANIRREQKLTSEDRILTLSTCVAGEKNKRYLVQGVLQERP